MQRLPILLFIFLILVSALFSATNIRYPLSAQNTSRNTVLYAYFNEQKYLHTGFFTRKGDCFISVYRYVYPAEYMDEVEKFDKTKTLTDSQKKLLSIVFDETDKLFTIEY